MKTLKGDLRLNWIDYARGIAIILVVYRHVFEGLKNTDILKSAGVDVNAYLYLEQANIFFFSFRMPLFFLVSGVFVCSSLAKRGFNALVENKARTILYPYFVWGFIQITIQIIFSVFINSKKTVLDYTYLFYVPREVEQFWYLYALFNVIILFSFLKHKFNLSSIQQLALGVILFLTSALFSQYGVEWGFISDIFHYYIFLAIGNLLSQMIVSGTLRDFFSSWKALAILLVPFALTQYYFLDTNIEYKALSPKYLYVEYHQPLVYLIIALTGCFFVITISSLLERYNTLKWLRYIGKHSLYIYVMHVIVFAAVRVVLTYVFKIYDIKILMLACITAGVVVPIICYQIAEKLGWQFLFTLEGNKRKNKSLAAKPVANALPTYES